jgi:hypothetical protein
VLVGSFRCHIAKCATSRRLPSNHISLFAAEINRLSWCKNQLNLSIFSRVVFAVSCLLYKERKFEIMSLRCRKNGGWTTLAGCDTLNFYIPIKRVLRLADDYVFEGAGGCKGAIFDCIVCYLRMFLYNANIIYCRGPGKEWIHASNMIAWIKSCIVLF